MAATPGLISGEVGAEQRGRIGLLTLERPRALNALSLGMVRDVAAALRAWRDDPAVAGVVLRGAGRPGQAPAFCAGGDIRFFREAALAGDPRLEDFFTEEYALDHAIHRYPKPIAVLMDGVCMGGGMGLAQGAALRIATEHSRLAMPETQIGFFPDVGGGWFLGRCPGRTGEYLALTGHVLGAGDAIALGLADGFMSSAALPALINALADQPIDDAAQFAAAVRARGQPAPPPVLDAHRDAIDRHFAAADLPSIVASLAEADSAFAGTTLAALRQRSPLMLAVTLEQLRRTRGRSLAEAFRLERGLVRQSLHLRGAAQSETVEGIRALVVDKDRAPRWNPARIDDVDAGEVARFFESPWPAESHPLRDLTDPA